jgi:hypothetical protein
MEGVVEKFKSSVMKKNSSFLVLHDIALMMTF